MKNSIVESNKLNFEIVAIGTSLGGLHALTVLLADLPKTFPLPIVIVQHRHKDSHNTLSDYLQQHSSLPVAEAEDKEPIAPGRVYLAPADYHLLIESPRDGEFSGYKNYMTELESATVEQIPNLKLVLSEVEVSQKIPNRGTHTFALSVDDPVCHARPSIDVLFESAADAFGEKAIGIILTGASSDGTKGIAKIKSKGGLTVVQEPESAECRIMPAAAIAAVAVDWILPLSKIASCLVNLVNN